MACGYSVAATASDSHDDSHGGDTWCTSVVAVDVVRLGGGMRFPEFLAGLG
jgi:hypothetical protein